MKKALFLLIRNHPDFNTFRTSSSSKQYNKKEKILKLAKEAIERYESDNTISQSTPTSNSFRNIEAKQYGTKNS
jgi:hypothetical protein